MKYLDNFKMFEGKLYIEDESHFEDDIPWEKTIDVSNLWKKYNEGIIDLKSYNSELAYIIEDNIGKDKNFKDVLKELKNEEDEEKSVSLWNKLYDIADENLIEIKC